MDTRDRGDDIQRRFRFQNAYAAYLSVLLLGSDSEYDVLYCEHHEDILVKLKNGEFIGVQVKTRDPAYGSFRFSDSEIMKALAGFVKHEMNFPNVFRNYIICSNCGFSNKKDASGLTYCLEIVNKHGGSKSCLEELDFSPRLRELSNATGASEDIVLTVLKKVNAVNWADLSNYETVLVHDIAVYTGNQHQSYDILQKISEQLIGIAFRAAALSHGLSQPSYYGMLKDPKKAASISTLENKKITSKIVEDSINQCVNSLVTLQGVSPIQVSALPRGMNVMELKLATGGINYGSICLMKDFDASAFKLLLEWFHIHGKSEVDRRAEHLRLLVQNECQEAYDLTRNPNRPYGSQMLQAVRDRLRLKNEEVRLQYHECRYEHLLGIAGILTEDCKVWWSEQFDIPVEVETR